VFDGKVVRHSFSHGLLKCRPNSTTRNMNCSSTYSPRTFGCLIFMPRFFIRPLPLLDDSPVPGNVSPNKKRGPQGPRLFRPPFGRWHIRSGKGTVCGK
jgi:hypothetical protein